MDVPTILCPSLYHSCFSLSLCLLYSTTRIPFMFFDLLDQCKERRHTGETRFWRASTPAHEMCISFTGAIVWFSYFQFLHQRHCILWKFDVGRAQSNQSTQWLGSFIWLSRANIALNLYLSHERYWHLKLGLILRYNPFSKCFLNYFLFKKSFKLMFL